MTSGDVTSVYLVCFHSEKPPSFEGSKRQFLAVEKEIEAGIWPYDNGDDPSFFVARKGGPLTWGVCRQDLRNSIRVGSIVVFFSFTSMKDDTIQYRLCAVTTVLSKLDVRAIHRDERFKQFKNLYINALVRPEKDGWKYDESDRAEPSRHPDWLWRISDHQGMNKERFNQEYARIYENEFIPNECLRDNRLSLAENYILFSTSESDSYISKNPPRVAIAIKGEHEAWHVKSLKALTVDTAAKFLPSQRNYLRVANGSGRNVHRQIHFQMPTLEVMEWRARLIAALKKAEKIGKPSYPTDRSARTAKC